ncbi:cytoplasmic tRNA 2-thiolation protein 1-like [Plakobranchus ocellatus]|uniref:Cytoplasmic tRNA 2-thiolation protein 1-like n=1 Tax=Plakobranchus ocellatus TaxID=259542 RepID=A0AAV4DXQ8_9GAST|nr:cytoplasmic tRNA 2-thiolation protein 1-like [Plakobranchus ocellatus]
MPRKCGNCDKNAVLKRPKTGDALCKECFYWAFEEEIHHTIAEAGLFSPGDTVAIGASGGKGRRGYYSHCGQAGLFSHSGYRCLRQEK